jgi:hypothetical protein
MFTSAIRRQFLGWPLTVYIKHKKGKEKKKSFSDLSYILAKLSGYCSEGEFSLNSSPQVHLDIKKTDLLIIII